MTQPLALGIDIGGTNTAFGIVDEEGNIVEQGSMPTKGFATINLYLKALKKELSPLLKKAGKDNILGIGIGAPLANHYTGEIDNATNLEWHGVIPICKLVSDMLQLPVWLTNDANAAALGEMRYGSAKGMKDFIMLTLGTGLGSGIVANGQLIYGHDSFAGEMGHITAVREGGRECSCGRYGCLEQYASATGIALTAEKWLNVRTDESVLRRHKGMITGRIVTEAARGGDALALEIFDYTAIILGQVLADAVAMTSPEAFVFFGGLAKAGDILLNPAKKYMEQNLLHVYKNKVKLLVSSLPDADAAILGAAALVWHHGTPPQEAEE